MMRLITVLFLLLQQLSFAQIGFLDQTFAADGHFSYDPTPDMDRMFSITMQKGGKILAGCIAGEEGSGYVSVLRLLNNGEPDLSFGDSGLVQVYPAIGYSFHVDIAVQGDGKILVGSSGSYRFTVARLDPNGTLDSSYGENGIVVHKTGVSAFNDFDMLLLKNQQLVVSAKAEYNPHENVLYKFLNSGALDSSFAVNGKLVIRPYTTFSYSDGILAEKEGKILFVCNKTDWPNGTFAFCYLNNGSPDTAFADSGYARIPLYGNNLVHVGITSDGSILGVGFISNLGASFVKYKPNGDPDSSFGTFGGIIHKIGKYYTFPGYAYELPDKKILVGGSAEDSSSNSFFLLRLDSLGEIDSSFGQNGVFRTYFGTHRTIARGGALQADGKLLICGFSYQNSWDTGYMRITRFHRESELAIGSPMSRNSEILIYPNPGDHSITISSLNEALKLLQIFNINGSAMYSSELRELRTIDTSTWPRSIYTLVISEGSSVHHKRFILR